MLNAMTTSWWMLVIRGILAVLFGVLAIIVPGITLSLLVIMFGAYVLVEGAINIYIAFRTRQLYAHWWIGLLEGIAGVSVGILTFIWPGITGIILLYLIAAWAIITGILEIAVAVQLRKEIESEWMLGFTGVLSVLFGVLLLISPVSGAVAVSWLIGSYAFIFGISMVALGFRLREESPLVTRTG